MDLIDFDNVKSEKAKALRRYNRLRSIGRVFRAAEVFVALLFLTWSFTRLPFAVQISGEFLRHLAGIVSGPLFMFLLGNSIVIALLAKSANQSSASAADTYFYDAFVRSGENRGRQSHDNQTEESIVYEDKQMIVTETNSNSESHASEDHALNDAEKESDTKTNDLTWDRPKNYRRSKSEISVKKSEELMVKGTLRRSETEKSRRREKDTEAEAEAEEWNYAEDELSNEEFQKTIEEFIAKQLRFRRKESMAVVLHN